MAEFDGISIGELARMQVAAERRNAEALAAFEQRVNKKFEEQSYVPRGEYELRLASLEKEVGSINERLRWGSRALVTAILLTPVSAAVTAFVVTR
jgi:hypothetical protein